MGILVHHNAPVQCLEIRATIGGDRDTETEALYKKKRIVYITIQSYVPLVSAIHVDNNNIT